jgi:hypothetical protein
MNDKPDRALVVLDDPVLTGREKAEQMSLLLRDRAAEHAVPNDYGYTPPANPHDVKLAFIEGSSIPSMGYTGVRWCTNCLQAELAVGFTNDPWLPILDIEKWKVTKVVDMGSECKKRKSV